MELRLLGWMKLHEAPITRMETLGYEEVENDEVTCKKSSIAPAACHEEKSGKNKRHFRDDINSEKVPRVCKKIRERKSSNRRYGTATVCSWILSTRIFSTKPCSSLSHARARAKAYCTFYYEKKFPHGNRPDRRDVLLFAESILTATSEHSSDNRIKPGALAVYISDYIQAQMRIVSFDLDSINIPMIYRATYYNAAWKISLRAVS